MTMPVSALSLLLAPLALQTAQPLEDLGALQARMAAVAGAPLHELDPRLRLRACPTPAQVGMTQRTAFAACPQLGWRVHALVIGGSSTGDSGPVIRRGDAVALRVPGRGFAVTLRAIALEDGAVGDRIRLRAATGSARPMTATVTASGEATP